VVENNRQPGVFFERRQCNSVLIHSQQAVVIVPVAH